MRITLRVFGLDLLALSVTTDDDAEAQAPPVTFGFHTSGAGLIERQPDEATEFDGYDRRA